MLTCCCPLVLATARIGVPKPEMVAETPFNEAGRGILCADTTPGLSTMHVANIVASDPGTRPGTKLAAFTAEDVVISGTWAVPLMRHTVPLAPLLTYGSPDSSKPNAVMLKPEASSRRLVQDPPCWRSPQIMPLQ